MNAHKTFRRYPGRLLNVLYKFNLNLVSKGQCNLIHIFVVSFMIKNMVSIKLIYIIYVDSFNSWPICKIVQHVHGWELIEYTREVNIFEMMKLLNASTAWKVSVCGVFVVRMFPHSGWIRRDTEYLSVFSPNMGKCKKIRMGVKLWIRTLFTQSE